MRRPLQITAGLGLTWLALRAVALAAPPSTAPPAVSAPPPAPAAGDTPTLATPATSPPAGREGAMPAEAPPVASYTLHATLDPQSHTIEGKGTILWKNASSVPQQEIWVHLYMNGFKTPRTVFMRFPGADAFRGGGSPSTWGSITVTRLAVRGGEDLWPGADKTSPGDPEDETDIRVPLPAPVAPGAELQLDVEFESRLPPLFFRTGYHDGFHMVGQWFPKIARREPDGRWAHFAFHHLSEFYADYGAYDVTVDTPADMIVGATGKPAGEVRLGGRVAQRFVQSSVHDFAFTAWSKFQELTALDPSGVSIRVLYPPGFERCAAEELDAVRRGLRFFGDAFGRYPYPNLTVVHPPTGAEEAGGMEYPTLITTGGNWYLPWTGAHFIDGVTLHELGHQWFYGMVATDEHAHPFLDEGLNSYAEALVQEAAHGPGSAFGNLGLAISLPAIQRAASADAARNAPVAQAASAFVSGRDLSGLVYNRTATIFSTLAGVYGKDPVRRALGRYTRRHRYRHPGPEDLLQAVREVVGDDAAVQLRAALFDTATVDYAVDGFESTADEAPGTGFHGHALLHRRGALRFPVDVDLLGADGSVQRVRWDAVESAFQLPYHGASQLAGAVIDPEHRVLLDDDLSNNARTTSPSRLSAALLDRFTFAAEAALAGLLP